MSRHSRDADRAARRLPSLPERREAELKLRKGGRNCPVCLQALPSLSGKGRVAQTCASCAAQPQPTKRCVRCHQAAVWESGGKAGCQACGHHGSKVRVIAGALDKPPPAHGM